MFSLRWQKLQYYITCSETYIENLTTTVKIEDQRICNFSGLVKCEFHGYSSWTLSGLIVYQHSASSFGTTGHFFFFLSEIWIINNAKLIFLVLLFKHSRNKNKMYDLLPWIFCYISFGVKTTVLKLQWSTYIKLLCKIVILTSTLQTRYSETLFS